MSGLKSQLDSKNRLMPSVSSTKPASRPIVEAVGQKQQNDDVSHQKTSTAEPSSQKFDRHWLLEICISRLDSFMMFLGTMLLLFSSYTKLIGLILRNNSATLDLHANAVREHAVEYRKKLGEVEQHSLSRTAKEEEGIQQQIEQCKAAADQSRAKAEGLKKLAVGLEEVGLYLRPGIALVVLLAMLWIVGMISFFWFVFYTSCPAVYVGVLFWTKGFSIL